MKMSGQYQQTEINKNKENIYLYIYLIFTTSSVVYGLLPSLTTNSRSTVAKRVISAAKSSIGKSSYWLSEK